MKSNKNEQPLRCCLALTRFILMDQKLYSTYYRLTESTVGHCTSVWINQPSHYSVDISTNHEIYPACKFQSGRLANINTDDVSKTVTFTLTTNNYNWNALEMIYFNGLVCVNLCDGWNESCRPFGNRNIHYWCRRYLIAVNIDSSGWFICLFSVLTRRFQY